MILTSAAHGNKYVKDVKTNLTRVLPYFNNHFILTDNVEELKNFNVVKYQRGIWSYIEKLIFSLKIAISEKSDVIFIDADELEHTYIDLLIKKPFVKDKINYIETWPGLTHYNELDSYWDTFKEYFKSNRQLIIPDNLPIIWEYFCYFPYNENTQKLLDKLEEIQPVLEYTNLINKPLNINIRKRSKNNRFQGIGHGEAVALTIAAFLTGVEFNRLDDKYRKIVPWN